jgi:uncharacterized protein with GYD domain
MAKYLWHGSYSVAGINGVMKDGGSGRVKAVRDLVESVGGSLESFYWGFGKDDYYITVNLPDNVTAAAVAMTVAATGSASVATVPLLEAADIDRAITMHPNYRKPGG